eukprot:CAMPEP_0116550124 /NCGR_PEP_ID=MMETSP0397-20121206/5258_1 /TAXON_ID=216820 /ORGANISM="Cyclophora tenuis, Strain ECT3854" /LENGTH=215 /DNA_ID=CAMNT_0004074931 /DNA_START=81 /DNA_END=728 /DNA_ORIENTATION=+
MIKPKILSMAAARNEESESMFEGATSGFVNSLGPSPKMAALLAAISEMKDGEKGVIFSQFPKFLHEIEKLLDERGYTSTRIDGSRSAKQRIDSLRCFSSEDDNDDDDDGPRFMGGTGINLTRANHIYMMDTWWNSAVENQAMDRVHRIGQKRDVRVVRFVMTDSIEERMIEIQGAKAAIGKGTMEKLSPQELRKARIGDLKSLFQLENATNTRGE